MSTATEEAVKCSHGVEGAGPYNGCSDCVEKALTVNYLMGISSGWEEAAKWLDDRAVESWRKHDPEGAKRTRSAATAMLGKAVGKLDLWEDEQNKAATVYVHTEPF